MLKSVPTITELKPFPFLSQLFSDDYYSDFAQAIRQRLNMENICSSKNVAKKILNNKKNLTIYLKTIFQVWEMMSVNMNQISTIKKMHIIQNV